MRAPSIELLRALRTAVTNTSAASATSSPPRQICLRQVCSSRTCRRATSSVRTLATTSMRTNEPRPRTISNPYAPTHRDRGPKSSEDTQTDFGAMDVLGHIPTPATSIDACTTDGFHLDNGVKTDGGSGIMLVGGEAFSWRPWQTQNQEATIGSLLDTRKGILDFPIESLGLLQLLHPKPDLLIVGTGGRLWMLSKETRAYVSEVLGCRVDVMDTANAAAAYNLLAKERGVEGGSGVGGLFLPVGWVGIKETGRRR